MVVEIRCIKTKHGSCIPVLVVNGIYVTFEREKILRVADIRPSELDKLKEGDVIKL